MNKWLIRNLRPATRTMAPQTAAKLVRLIKDRTKGSRTQEEAQQQIKRLIIESVKRLSTDGMSPDRIFEGMSIIGHFAILWIDLSFALLLASFSPAILLRFCLASTLDNNLLPERRDFSFEGIKQTLLDRHWPPQRQRCDFVPAPAAIN
jgi:hypothetical protein